MTGLRSLSENELDRLYRGRSKEVDLSRYDLGPVDAALLLNRFLTAEELNSSKWFYRFELCNMSLESCRIICDTMANMTNVCGVSFSCNNFSSEEIVEVSQMIRKNLQIQKVYLDGNNFGPLGMQSLTNDLSTHTNLNTLHLCDNNITPESAIFIASNLLSKNNLHTLILKNNKLSSLGILHMRNILVLQENKSLTHLDISFNKIGTEGSQHIADLLQHNHSLQYLILEGNEIQDEGISLISNSLYKNTSLKHLNLSSNSCSPIGALHISNALSQNQSLQELILTRNVSAQCAIGMDGGEHLAQMLRVNHSLVKLDLFGSCIGCKGGEAIAAALEENDTLTLLNIAGSYVGPNALMAIQNLLLSHKNKHIARPNKDYTNSIHRIRRGSASTIDITTTIATDTNTDEKKSEGKR
eukprot:gene9325-19354_t